LKETDVIEDGTTPYERAMVSHLRTRVGRSQFLMAAGAGIVAAAYPRAAGAQTTTPESVQDILNIAVTAEHLAVTLLTAAVQNATQLNLTGLLLAVTQAALVEEQLHADFLEANGAKTLTDSFTVPDPKILTDQKTFLHTLADTAEPLFIAAYMAAVREFTDMKQPMLAKFAYQIGGTEAEHRAIVRAGLVVTGDMSGDPPNNKAFETNALTTVGDATKALMSLGFIGGTGQAATYPGRTAALAAAGSLVGAVTQTTPNSTVPAGVTTAAYPVLKQPRHHHRRRSHHRHP